MVICLYGYIIYHRLHNNNLWLSVYMDILYTIDYIILSHLLVHCIETTPDDGQLWAETCCVINKYI
jgi:hypothetical protein